MQRFEDLDDPRRQSGRFQYPLQELLLTALCAVAAGAEDYISRPLAGRELVGRIAAVLRERTPRPQGVLVQLSVEIVDMDRPSYIKERL